MVRLEFASLELPERHSVIAVELQIQIVESLALAAVYLVNPLADSGLLVEDGAIQTEEFYVHNLVWNQVSRWRRESLFGDALDSRGVLALKVSSLQFGPDFEFAINREFLDILTLLNLIMSKSIINYIYFIYTRYVM